MIGFIYISLKQEVDLNFSSPSLLRLLDRFFYVCEKNEEIILLLYSNVKLVNVSGLDNFLTLLKGIEILD